VRAGTIQVETLGASLFLAAAVIVAAGVSGHASLGIGVGVGLILGSINGFIIQFVLDRRAPILPTSVLRLALISLLALVAARFAGGSIWPVVIGVGFAQLVMVGVGVRQGRRA
jgi:hypothetical protein